MKVVWLIVPLVLVACDRAAPPVANETAPSATNEITTAEPPPAANQIAPPVVTSAIPEAFHGAFDTDATACAAASSIYRLTISAADLRFHESLGTARMVTSDGDSAIRVAADYSGEGMEWSNTQRLALTEDGAMLTISGEGPPIVRSRCPA